MIDPVNVDNAIAERFDLIRFHALECKDVKIFMRDSSGYVAEWCECRSDVARHESSRTNAETDKGGHCLAKVRAHLPGCTRGFPVGTFGGEDREEGVCVHRGGGWSDFDEREAAAIEEKGADAFIRRADGVRTGQTRLGDVHVSARDEFAD